MPGEETLADTSINTCLFDDKGRNLKGEEISQRRSGIAN